MIKSSELEDVDWEDAKITEKTPPAWFPNCLNKAHNYQGPRMSWGDHYNSREAQEAWVRKERAKYWCEGKGVEYGHTRDSLPHVRLVYGPIRGKSMWYPLFKAAKTWNEMSMDANQAYKRAVTNAELDDKDGPIGRQHVDDDGLLIYPHEDLVPYRTPSISSEEQIIPQ